MLHLKQPKRFTKDELHNAVEIKTRNPMQANLLYMSADAIVEILKELPNQSFANDVKDDVVSIKVTDSNSVLIQYAPDESIAFNAHMNVSDMIVQSVNMMPTLDYAVDVASSITLALKNMYTIVGGESVKTLNNLISEDRQKQKFTGPEELRHLYIEYNNAIKVLGSNVLELCNHLYGLSLDSLDIGLAGESTASKGGVTIPVQVVFNPYITNPFNYTRITITDDTQNIIVRPLEIMVPNDSDTLPLYKRMIQTGLAYDEACNDYYRESNNTLNRVNYATDNVGTVVVDTRPCKPGMTVKSQLVEGILLGLEDKSLVNNLDFTGSDIIKMLDVINENTTVIDIAGEEVVITRYGDSDCGKVLISYIPEQALLINAHESVIDALAAKLGLVSNTRIVETEGILLSEALKVLSEINHAWQVCQEAADNTTIGRIDNGWLIENVGNKLFNENLTEYLDYTYQGFIGKLTKTKHGIWSTKIGGETIVFKAHDVDKVLISFKDASVICLSGNTTIGNGFVEQINRTDDRTLVDDAVNVCYAIHLFNDNIKEGWHE